LPLQRDAWGPGIHSRPRRADSAATDIAAAVDRGYCESMKNVTVSLDDETWRKARIKAAELNTSVSALVKRFLNELGAGESEFERLKREERALRAQVPSGFSAKDNLPRDRLYDRGR
jgi:hypothetical protein